MWMRNSDSHFFLQGMSSIFSHTSNHIFDCFIRVYSNSIISNIISDLINETDVAYQNNFFSLILYYSQVNLFIKFRKLGLLNFLND